MKFKVELTRTELESIVASLGKYRKTENEDLTTRLNAQLNKAPADILIEALKELPESDYFMRDGAESTIREFFNSDILNTKV